VERNGGVSQPTPSPVLSQLPPVLACVKDDLERLEAHLQDRTGVGLPAVVALLEWVFASGGKRIRPALVFAVSRLGQADAAAVLNLAAAIETLHAATLVHDDLVDGSLVRRGMPTVNKRWGANATVLAGDWLFARAAWFAAETESVAVLKAFARTLGTLTDGELRQLFGRSGVPDRDEYDYRIYAKTASLFEAATESAGELLNESPSRIAALATFGRELGSAFQIADDILDFAGTESSLGKPVGGDLRSGQVTLPVMLHLQGHPDAAPWLNGDLEDPPDGAVDRLVAAVRADEHALNASMQAALDAKRRAVEALHVFPESEARADLARIADYAVARRR
jgi:geranylgeranyl pyrophosphate synthase